MRIKTRVFLSIFVLAEIFVAQPFVLAQEKAKETQGVSAEDPMLKELKDMQAKYTARLKEIEQNSEEAKRINGVLPTLEKDIDQRIKQIEDMKALRKEEEEIQKQRQAQEPTGGAAPTSESAAGKAAQEGKGSLFSETGARVVKIEGYAEDYSDGSIGTWDSYYPHPSFDDEDGRSGLPNGAWDGSYYFKGDTLYLVIDNLYAQYPPSHNLGIGYTVTLEGGTFKDGTETKNLIVYTYSGTPAEKRIVKGFSLASAEKPEKEKLAAPKEEPKAEKEKVFSEERCKECKKEYNKLCSNTDTLMGYFTKEVSKLPQKQKTVMDEYNNIVTKVSFERKAENYDEATPGWRGPAEKVRQIYAYSIGVFDSRLKEEVYHRAMREKGAWSYFQGIPYKDGSVKVDKYQHSDFTQKVDSVFNGMHGVNNVLIKLVGDMKAALAEFAGKARGCGVGNELNERYDKVMAAILKMQRLADEYDSCVLEFKSVAYTLSSSLEAAYKETKEKGHADELKLDGELTKGRKACDTYKRMQQIIPELENACREFQETRPYLNNVCQNCFVEKE